MEAFTMFFTNISYIWSKKFKMRMQVMQFYSHSIA
jgi:hypothetical protein